MEPDGIKFTQCVSGQRSAFSPLQEQEAQLMLTTGSTRLAVNQGQQT